MANRSFTLWTTDTTGWTRIFEDVKETDTLRQELKKKAADVDSKLLKKRLEPFDASVNEENMNLRVD